MVVGECRWVVGRWVAEWLVDGWWWVLGGGVWLLWSVVVDGSGWGWVVAVGGGCGLVADHLKHAMRSTVWWQGTLQRQ